MGRVKGQGLSMGLPAYISFKSSNSTSKATFNLDNGGGNQQKTIYSALSYCQAGGMAS